MIVYIDTNELENTKVYNNFQKAMESFLEKIIENKSIVVEIVDYKNKIDIQSIKPTQISVFFDIQYISNTSSNKSNLYANLKKNGFLIYNFLFDLKSSMEEVCKHSDLIFFNSLDLNNSFLKLKEKHTTKNIPTRVINSGFDFLQNNVNSSNEKYKDILQSKYILCTSKIKLNQSKSVDISKVLTNKYQDITLVYIDDYNLDDITLNDFYKNAFLVISFLDEDVSFLTHSLSHGNITITLKSSITYAVGQDYADYILYESINELVSLISLYYENENIYKSKKRYIKDNFKAKSSVQFTNSIVDVFINHDQSIKFKKNHFLSLQFVFISIDKHNLEKTIKSIDKHMDFVKEYIIVTQLKLIKEFKKISSTHKIIVIDENEILGKYKKDFSKRDHQSKNWLLRASLLHLDILDEEFIMLDDDNQPIKDIHIDKFIDKDGRYNAYYFYNLLDWHHHTTDYDKGQQNMKQILTQKNYELLSYSSHAPQIINKKILQEVVDEFFVLGLNTAIDEWTTYFNYATSKYPCTFNKKIYETLNWPVSSANWDMSYIPKEHSFENYYKEIYDLNSSKLLANQKDKIQTYKKELEPYLQTKEIFKQTVGVLSHKNMVHKTMPFITKNIEFYLSNVPYFVILKNSSDIKLRLNYKLLNYKQSKLDISIVLYLDGSYRTLRKVNTINHSTYQEGIVELPITSKNLTQNVYDITFDLLINNKYVYKKMSPYLMKLVVTDKTNLKEFLDD